MLRNLAQILVNHVTIPISQYKAVESADCWDLLGTEVTLRIATDAIRKAGPTRDTFYPWNVVDYLVDPEVRIKELERSKQRGEKR